MKFKLSEIFDLQIGKTPSRHNSMYWNDGNREWISISDISGSKYISNTKEKITEKAIQDSGIKKIPANTVIMSFKLSIGKVAITSKEMYSNEAIMAFIDKKRVKLFPEYVYYLLMGVKWDQNTNNAVMGKTLNKSTISQIIVDIDDYEIQKQKAEALNFASKQLDIRNKEIHRLDTLVKARFVEMFGDPRINPNGYEVEELRSSCTVVTGNTPPRSVEEYYGDDIEWIKTDNIVSGKTRPTQAVECLSEKGMRVGRIVDENAILMACIAGSIASIGRVCITDRKVAFNQQINAVIPKHYDVRFLYVLLQLSKDYLVEGISMALKGILSKSKLEDKVFYVPPMELQEQFATFFSQVDKSKVVVKKISKFHNISQEMCVND